MKTRYKFDKYATHQPALFEVLKRVQGDILELGIGNGSTSIIKSSLSSSQKLISLESNKEWFDKFKHLESENHHLFFVDAGNEDNLETGLAWTDYIEENLNEYDFEFVFIDQSPWAARTSCLQYFVDKAKYILVHDVDYYATRGIWGSSKGHTNIAKNKVKYDMDFSDVAKYSRVFYPVNRFFFPLTGPPTLVCSNFVELDDISTDSYYE